jgi:hypothetical protein
MLTRFRTACPAALLTPAAVIAVIATLALSWAPAAHDAPAAAGRALVTPVPGHALPLTAEQAVAMARATKKPVVVSSLTTPDSLTTADSERHAHPHPDAGAHPGLAART